MFAISPQSPSYTQAAESVIFEQFGTMVGSTSYLHVHIPLYISKMLEQHNKYRDYLTSKFETPEKIRSWLFAGAFHKYNITAAMVQSGNLTKEEANLLSALSINSRLYWELAQLHLKDLSDIKGNIRSLHNLMPDLKAVPVHEGDRSERTPSDDDYNDEDDSDLRRNPDGLFVAQPFPDDHDPFCDSDDPSCGPQNITDIPDDVDLAGKETEDPYPVPGRSPTRKTTTTTTTTRKPLNVKVGASVVHHIPSKQRVDLWDVPHRIKRFAGLVALPLAIAATGMGLYNRKQLESLRAELFDVRSNTQRLFRIAQDLTIGLQQVDTAMEMMRTTLIVLVASNPAIADARMTRIENQLRHRVQAAIHAIQSAIHGRLSIDYLDPRSIAKLFRQVKERATALGCDLLLEYHTDLFSIETSLLFDGRDGHLILHLPMAPKEGQLRLFRLHPFPLPLFDDRYLIPDVKNDVIAISSTDSRLNVQLAAVELLSCHRMSQLFLCDNFGVLSRRFNQTCLGALYFSMFAEAEKVCKFKVVPAEEQVYQIHKGEFIVYSPHPVTVAIRCRNGTATEKHLKKGSQRFSLSKGCSGDLSLHKVIADYSSDLGNEIKIFEWDWDSVNFMDGKDKELADALDKLHRIKIHTPDLSELQYVASMEHQLPPDSTGEFLVAICVTGLVVACLLCAVCCYCWCQRYRCCRGDSARDRRGQKKRRSRKGHRSRLPLCCCQRHSESEPSVRFSRTRRTEDEDSDEVVDIADAQSMRYAGLDSVSVQQMSAGLQHAEERIDQRLDKLQKDKNRLSMTK